MLNEVDCKSWAVFTQENYYVHYTAATYKCMKTGKLQKDFSLINIKAASALRAFTEAAPESDRSVRYDQNLISRTPHPHTGPPGSLPVWAPVWTARSWTTQRWLTAAWGGYCSVSPLLLGNRWCMPGPHRRSAEGGNKHINCDDKWMLAPEIKGSLSSLAGEVARAADTQSSPAAVLYISCCNPTMLSGNPLLLGQLPSEGQHLFFLQMSSQLTLFISESTSVLKLTY